MMEEFPHHYRVTAFGAAEGDVELQSQGLPILRSAPPRQFDGPGNRWSPETLLAAAVSDCFVLTFRAVARASRLDWTSLECHVVGTVDRVDRTMRFIRFDIRARLTVADEGDRERAVRALEKAERGCLISNSLRAEVHVAAEVEADASAVRSVSA